MSEHSANKTLALIRNKQVGPMLGLGTRKINTDLKTGLHTLAIFQPERPGVLAFRFYPESYILALGGFLKVRGMTATNWTANIFADTPEAQELMQHNKELLVKKVEDKLTNVAGFDEPVISIGGIRRTFNLSEPTIRAWWSNARERRSEAGLPLPPAKHMTQQDFNAMYAWQYPVKLYNQQTPPQ